jgi:hypothetical protein
MTIVLLTCLQPGLDMEHHLRDKVDLLMNKLKCAQLQPHDVVIAPSSGEGLEQSTAYAVLGPKIYYRMDNVVLAVDVVLKSCFVFDVEYPVASRSCWTFLQRAIYEIIAAEDVVSTRLQELIGSL